MLALINSLKHSSAFYSRSILSLYSWSILSSMDDCNCGMMSRMQSHVLIMYTHFISTSSTIAFSGRDFIEGVEPGRPNLIVSQLMSKDLDGICLFKRFLQCLNTFLNEVYKSKSALLVLKLVHLLIESLIFLNRRRLDEYTLWSSTSNLSFMPTQPSIVSMILRSSLSEYDLRYGSNTSDMHPLKRQLGLTFFTRSSSCYYFFFFFILGFSAFC